MRRSLSLYVIMGFIACSWVHMWGIDDVETVGMQPQTASFLHGTLPLAAAEKVEGVDGSVSHVIDQKQYDQIQNYFLHLIAATPTERDKLWQLDFSSVRAYETSLHAHRQSLTRMLGIVQVQPQPPTAIRGRFYVSNLTPELAAFAVKIARVGHPGNLIVRLGTMESADDIAELRLRAADVDEGLGLWYELKLKGPKKLDPRHLYWFELRAESGDAPQGGYRVYGPAPLGGTDYPHNFGLSFKTISGEAEKSQ